MAASLLTAATIGRTHGLEGYLKVYSLSGEYDHLMRLKECVIAGRDGKERSALVESARSQGDLLLMRFKGYDTPEKARALSGSDLLIRRSDAPELEEGEVYVADLYGLTVMHDGTAVGEVVDTSEGAQALLLHIRREGRIHLVPYLPVFISHPDLEKGTIELMMPELLG